MHLDKLIKYHGCSGPVLLVVADGVGIAESGPANALSLARTPVIDGLLSSTHSTQLHAHGPHVGLPTENDMGNSEVGHNTLGGGRIFDQGAKLVNSAFANGSIFLSPAWQEIETRGKRGQTIHFLGLLSDGNVHSHMDHLFQMLQRCQQQQIKSVCVHILLDGRDVDPRSSPHYVESLETQLKQINQNPDFHYRIASGGGRMAITMDRYQADWDMVRRGYQIHVHGNAQGIGSEVTSALHEIKRQHNSDPNLSDQYIEPFVVVDENGPVGRMAPQDGVVLFNFRGDRAIEICQAMENPDFDSFDRGSHPELYFCGLLQYDGDLNVPKNYLVNPPVIERTMVEFMCAEQLPTFAVSETQKFGHVTYFWNGNKSGYIDETLETYVEIPSDNCEFDQAPEMQAREITDATIELLKSNQYRFGRINFANGDMVGHTGNIPATVTSLECVDQCMGRLIECIQSLDGVLIFTADHGNADEMFVLKNGERIKRTSHTLNPVPFVIVESTQSGQFEIDRSIEGGLANVAATVFNLLGYRAPDDYEPSLIKIPQEPNRNTIYKGRIVNLGLETTLLPNDEMIAMEVVRHPGGSVVIAMDHNQRVCLIRQFRYSAGGWIWEFPAGILDASETPDETAVRELAEETGCSASQWIPLGSTLTTPGFCDERLHLFLAKDLQQGSSSPEAHEFIETHWKDLAEVEQMVESGEMDDAKSIVALFRLKQYLWSQNER